MSFYLILIILVLIVATLVVTWLSLMFYHLFKDVNAIESKRKKELSLADELIHSNQ